MGQTMSYYNHTSKLIRIIFLSILFISNLSLIPQATAAVKMPNCTILNSWAAIAYTKNKSLPGNTFLRSKLLLDGFKDELMKKVFGKTFNQWSDADFIKLRKKALACDPRLAEQIRAAQQKRNRELITVLQGARGFTYGYLKMGTPNYYNMVIAQQRKNYTGSKKSTALVAKQRKELKAMKATTANIKKITSMARNPDLLYLTPFESRNHHATLRGYGTKLSGDIVVNAADKFKSYPKTVDGLRKLQAYRTKLQKDLTSVEQYKWKTFNAALNDIASASVGDFEKQLNALPATAQNVRKVKASVNNLFKFLVEESTLKSYRKVVKKRMVSMRQELRKNTCYKSLDMMGLKKKYHDVPMLSYTGESTLGLLICDISRAGNKFQKYEDASLFGSTYTLTLLSRRGISITIGMKKVEAVEGKKMLAGTVIKDASSETKLTLTGWQDYVAKLAGRKRGRY